MRTPQLALAALVAVGALAAGLLPVAPASAQVIDTMSVTKIVSGDGPQAGYPDDGYRFDLVCGDDEGTSFGLANGETLEFASTQVDFQAGQECALYETDTWGATDVHVLVTASNGTEVPVAIDGEGDEIRATFTTVDDVDIDYTVVVINDFPAGDGDICPSVEALGSSLDVLLEQIAGGGDLTPGELEQLWTTFTKFLFDSLAVVPEDQLPAFQTAALAFLQIADILVSVDFDVTALTEDQTTQIDGILSSAEFGIESVGTYLVTACAPIVTTTTTTTAAADPAVTTPRFTG